MTILETMTDILLQIRMLPDCRVFEPTVLPTINGTNHVLPYDVIDFYTACGGVVLFEHSDYAVRIVGPTDVVLANPIIIGDLCDDDMSSDWYIIGDDGSDEYITIDFNPHRLGRCYDSFYDRHGVVGESSIIATSFMDLLSRLILNKGQYWYWLRDDFITLGDAYDS